MQVIVEGKIVKICERNNSILCTSQERIPSIVAYYFRQYMCTSLNIQEQKVERTK
jgi:hypothetical protein